MQKMNAFQSQESMQMLGNKKQVIKLSAHWLLGRLIEDNGLLPFNKCKHAQSSVKQKEASLRNKSIARVDARAGLPTLLITQRGDFSNTGYIEVRN